MTKQHILQRLASENPISEIDAERTLTADQWQAMFEGIVSQEAPRHRQVAVHRRWKGTRLAALVAGALVIAILVPTLWSDAPTGASPAAADALHRAADAARSQRALPAPGPGQYLYFKTQERSTRMYVPGHGKTNFLFTQSKDVEAWTSAAGSGRRVIQPQGITFPTTDDRAAWERAGRPDLEDNPTDREYGAGGDFVLDLSEVPTDPEELLGAIERREILGGDGADWVTFQIIGELLPPVYRSPEHRAALYEVAANFPGVDYEGSVTVPGGRRGVSVSYDGGGRRWELIFDPDTAELLAERRILLEQEEDLAPEDNTWSGDIVAYAGPPGTVVWWNVFLQTAVVDSTDDRP